MLICLIIDRLYFVMILNLVIIYVHRTQGKWVEAVHIGGIVNALRDNGHTVLLTSPLQRDNDKIEKKSIFSDMISWFSEHLPESLFELGEIFYNVIIFWKLCLFYIQKRPDLIYERYAFFNVSGLLFSKLIRRPLLIEINYLTSTPIVRKRKQIFLGLAKLIEKFILERSDAIFVITEYVKHECINSGISPSKIISTPNGVDKKRIEFKIDPEKLKVKFKLDNEIVVGYIGAFFDWHRVDFLIHNAKILIENFENVKFILIGTGPNYEDIKNIVSCSELSNKVVFTGEIKHDHIWSYLSLFDIAVLPNSNNYGSPVKLFEYMAAGCAVVAPQIGPVQEIITHGENGLLFRSGDSVDFLNNISKLIRDEELRKRLGKNAKELVLSEYTWQNNANKILHFYESIRSR